MTEKVETLDYYVKKALDFFAQQGDYSLGLPESSHTLVVGSQTAYLAGRILYRFAGKRFSHATEVLAQDEIGTKDETLEDVTIVSATGSRNVIPIAQYALQKGLPVNAVVCEKDSELKREFDTDINEILVEAIEEPPTVNTATYGRMIQGVTHEDIAEIRKVVESLEEPQGGYHQFNAFTIILPDKMPEVAGMVDWKLRGEKIGRCVGTTCVYLTNFMHGAGVTDAASEVYVALGLNQQEREVFEQVFENVPQHRKHYIDVPDDFGPLGFMMLGYSVVGQIQKNYDAFQERVRAYDLRAKKWNWLSPIRIKIK